MKRVASVLLCSLLLASLLAACSKAEESPSTSEAPMQETVDLEGGEIPLGEEKEEPEEADDPQEAAAEETPAPDRDVNEVYETLANAAGITAALEMTMLDLNAGGGITTDNIVEMAGGQSKIGGDSGLVIVLYVQNGTVDTMVEELQAYRDSLIGGPAYDEFADAKTATESARIGAYGNYVVYVAVSVDGEASYDDVDAALAGLFG